MWWDIVSWDWVGFTKIAVGAGFGSAAISVLSNWFLANREHRSKAERLSHRIAVTLEGFGRDCFQQIDANDRAATFDRNRTIFVGAIDFPLDTEEGWSKIDKELAEKYLEFKFLCSKHAKDTVWFENNITCAILGLDALNLSRSLRAHYRLPKFSSFKELNFLEGTILALEEQSKLEEEQWEIEKNERAKNRAEEAGPA